MQNNKLIKHIELQLLLIPTLIFNNPPTFCTTQMTHNIKSLPKSKPPNYPVHPFVLSPGQAGCRRRRTSNLLSTTTRRRRHGFGDKLRGFNTLAIYYEYISYHIRYDICILYTRVTKDSNRWRVVLHFVVHYKRADRRVASGRTAIRSWWTAPTTLHCHCLRAVDVREMLIVSIVSVTII